MLGAGADLILEIARFFADLTRLNPDTGRYEITGVMGPDEFHDGYPGHQTPGVDNNAYTNVMTVWLLKRALDAVELLRCRHCSGLPKRIGIDAGELARWADSTARMYVPFLPDGVIVQPFQHSTHDGCLMFSEGLAFLAFHDDELDADFQWLVVASMWCSSTVRPARVARIGFVNRWRRWTMR